jgi:hypothetical protein
VPTSLDSLGASTNHCHSGLEDHHHARASCDIRALPVLSSSPRARRECACATCARPEPGPHSALGYRTSSEYGEKDEPARPQTPALWLRQAFRKTRDQCHEVANRRSQTLPQTSIVKSLNQLRLGSKEYGAAEQNRAVFILTAKNANATQARPREHATIPGHAEWPP